MDRNRPEVDSALYLPTNLTNLREVSSRYIERRGVERDKRTQYLQQRARLVRLVEVGKPERLVNLMKRKPGMTMEQHRKAGAQLRTMRNELVTLSVQVANAYPSGGSTSLVWTGLGKAVGGIDRARCWLEELMARDYPDEWSTDIYYGAEVNQGEPNP